MLIKRYLIFHFQKNNPLTIIYLQQVKDIVDGTVEVEEIDRQELEQEKMRKTMGEIKEREKLEKLVKGRPGKGHQPGYKSFCKFCFTEYLIDIEKCTHCNHDTMTYQVSNCCSSG